MDDSLETRPKSFRRMKGVGGDSHEMHANLDVCLQVGRFDRAATLIHRLARVHKRDSPDLLEIHNRYLQAMISHMIVTRQSKLVWPVQRWFEVDMQNDGVEPDAASYALMMRLALRMLHGPKRDRTVRRYWDLAKRAGVEDEVLGIPILSELELGELSEVRSVFNLTIKLVSFGGC
jgi:DNA-directed RNA polymerase